MAIRDRLVRGGAAYLYAQVVTAGLQLVSLPLFLAYWDAQTYGSWLILTAIPGYLALAEAGLMSATTNRMTSDLLRGQNAVALRNFRMSVSGLAVVSCTIMALIVIGVNLLPDSTSDFESWRVLVCALAASALLALFCSLAETIYKSSGQYALGTIWVTTGRLVEWVGGLIGLVVFVSPVAVAVCSMMSRSVYTFAFIRKSNRRVIGIKWGLEKIDWNNFRDTAISAGQFFMLTLSSLCNIHGMVIVIGVALGPAQVVLFTAYRTITRIPVQIVGAISNPMWPELARLDSANRHLLYSKLYTVVGVIVASTTVLLLLTVRPAVAAWTHQQVQAPYFDSLVLVLIGGINAVAQMPRVLLMASSSHREIAVYGLVIALMSLVGVYFAAVALGFLSALIALLIFECTNWLVLEREAQKFQRGEK